MYFSPRSLSCPGLFMGAIITCHRCLCFFAGPELTLFSLPPVRSSAYFCSLFQCRFVFYVLILLVLLLLVLLVAFVLFSRSDFVDFVGFKQRFGIILVAAKSRNLTRSKQVTGPVTASLFASCEHRTIKSQGKNIFVQEATTAYHNDKTTQSTTHNKHHEQKQT